MLDILRREGVYLWYYFSLQLEQIFGYWVLGMVLGSAISVFAKEHIHGLFRSMRGKRLGVLGIFAASTLGIASPLCMYGTIPLAASFSESGMEDDWLAAFMMSSILLNPQLILYSMALGRTALAIRILSSFLCGAAPDCYFGLSTETRSFSTLPAFPLLSAGTQTPIFSCASLKIWDGISRPPAPCSCWEWPCLPCSSGMFLPMWWPACSAATGALAS